jgi:hypothetical protein
MVLPPQVNWHHFYMNTVLYVDICALCEIKGLGCLSTDNCIKQIASIISTAHFTYNFSKYMEKYSTLLIILESHTVKIYIYISKSLFIYLEP